jgi:hypothetical protein
LYREAFTYVNITKSDLQPILITGSVAKVTRGWGQMLSLNPQGLSLDPDNVDDKVINLFFVAILQQINCSDDRSVPGVCIFILIFSMLEALSISQSLMPSAYGMSGLRLLYR